MLHFIGFYDYTVVLTYMGLISALCGIVQAAAGHFNAAVICLGICGTCDAFDGRIARTKKNRSDDEKAFGVQIDSLCDLVCFGVFPAFFCYQLGVNGVLGIAIISFYTICAVIRLAYYNVLEEKKKLGNFSADAAFHGLPVTLSSVCIALAYCSNFVLADKVFVVVMHIVTALVAFLFILDFRIEKKPSLKALILFIVLVSGFVIGSIVYYTLGA